MCQGLEASWNHRESPGKAVPNAGLRLRWCKRVKPHFPSKSLLLGPLPCFPQDLGAFWSGVWWPAPKQVPNPFLLWSCGCFAGVWTHFLTLGCCSEYFTALCSAYPGCGEIGVVRFCSAFRGGKPVFRVWTNGTVTMGCLAVSTLAFDVHGAEILIIYLHKNCAPRCWGVDFWAKVGAWNRGDPRCFSVNLLLQSWFFCPLELCRSCADRLGGQFWRIKMFKTCFLVKKSGHHRRSHNSASRWNYPRNLPRPAPWVLYQVFSHMGAPFTPRKASSFSFRGHPSVFGPEEDPMRSVVFACCRVDARKFSSEFQT